MLQPRVSPQGPAQPGLQLIKDLQQDVGIIVKPGSGSTGAAGQVLALGLPAPPTPHHQSAPSLPGAKCLGRLSLWALHGVLAGFWEVDDEGQHYGTQAKSGRKAGPGWVRDGELRLEPTLDPLWIQKANLVLLRRELTWKWGVPDLTSGQYRARWERKCSQGSARALPGSRPSSCPMAMAGWL